MDSAAKRRGALLTVLIVLTAVAVGTVPPWLERRARAEDVTRVLAAADQLATEFEECVVEGAAPPDYEQAITDRLLLDRDYQARFVACVDARDEASAELLASLEAREDEPEIIAALRLANSTRYPVYNPGRADICSALRSQRESRAEIRAALGRDDAALAEMRCAELLDNYDELFPRPVAPPEGRSDSGWQAQHATQTQLIALQRGYEFESETLVNIGPEAAAAIVELPAHFEGHALVRWGPSGPVGVARPDNTPYERGTEPYRIERWSSSPEGVAAFEPRPAPRGMGGPVELWLTAERWFLASSGADRNDITIHISDDEGASFRPLTPTLPGLPAARRFEISGHADGAELLLLAARKTFADKDVEPAFQELPAEAQLAVVRIDADGRAHAGALSFPHRTGFNWEVALDACSTGEGALAVIDGETVVHVEGLEAKVVHSFASGRELQSQGLAIACHGQQAVILARQRSEPEPPAPITGIDSGGGPLYRYMCDAEGCDAGEVATDWAYRWDLRGTEAGVRGLVELHVAPESIVYLVDEPPGGPFETRTSLNSYFAPLDAVVWDGVTFVPGSNRSRWGWF